MDFIKNITLFILKLQEKSLSKKLFCTDNIKYKRKYFHSKGCYLTLDSLAETEKQEMEKEISEILTKYEYNPSKLLEYIKESGTNVFYIESSKYLTSIGENEGFIYPQKNGRAMYLSLLTTGRFTFKTNEMFVLTKGEINKYYFLYHFYNWFAFKKGISGMDSESINLLNKYLFNASDKDIQELHLSDIYRLKNAIKQDKSSIEFILKLCKNDEGIKNAFSKLKDGGTKL